MVAEKRKPGNVFFLSLPACVHFFFPPAALAANRTPTSAEFNRRS